MKNLNVREIKIEDFFLVYPEPTINVQLSIDEVVLLKFLCKKNLKSIAPFVGNPDIKYVSDLMSQVVSKLSVT